MKRILISLFSLLSLSVAYGQDITLGLTVKDAHSGYAAENVEVLVMGPKGYEETVSTDRDGNIELAELASGVYFVQIESDTYVRYSKGFPVRKTENRQIFLTPAAEAIAPPTIASTSAVVDTVG